MFKQEKEIKDELAAVKKDLIRLQTDVSSLLDALQSAGKAKVGDAKDAVMGELEQAIAQLRTNSRSVLTGAEKEIVHHPLTAVAAAVGVGFILGKVLKA